MKLTEEQKQHILKELLNEADRIYYSDDPDETEIIGEVHIKLGNIEVDIDFTMIVDFIQTTGGEYMGWKENLDYFEIKDLEIDKVWVFVDGEENSNLEEDLYTWLIKNL